MSTEIYTPFNVMKSLHEALGASWWHEWIHQWQHAKKHRKHQALEAQETLHHAASVALYEAHQAEHLAADKQTDTYHEESVIKQFILEAKLGAHGTHHFASELNVLAHAVPLAQKDSQFVALFEAEQPGSPTLIEAFTPFVAQQKTALPHIEKKPSASTTNQLLAVAKILGIAVHLDNAPEGAVDRSSQTGPYPYNITLNESGSALLSMTPDRCIAGLDATDDIESTIAEAFGISHVTPRERCAFEFMQAIFEVHNQAEHDALREAVYHCIRTLLQRHREQEIIECDLEELQDLIDAQPETKEKPEIKDAMLGLLLQFVKNIGTESPTPLLRHELETTLDTSTGCLTPENPDTEYAEDAESASEKKSLEEGDELEDLG